MVEEIIELIICGLIVAGLSAAAIPFIYCAFYDCSVNEPENAGWGSHDWGTFCSQKETANELVSMQVVVMDTVSPEDLVRKAEH